MKKNEATMRQINAVKEELDRKLKAMREAWNHNNPRPSWKIEEDWERKHRSPRQMHGDAEQKAMKAFEAKREAILFDAKMGKITAEELYAKANAF